MCSEGVRVVVVWGRLDRLKVTIRERRLAERKKLRE
jgi:hypothetical protein